MLVEFVNTEGTEEVGFASFTVDPGGIVLAVNADATTFVLSTGTETGPLVGDFIVEVTLVCVTMTLATYENFNY